MGEAASGPAAGSPAPNTGLPDPAPAPQVPPVPGSILSLTQSFCRPCSRCGRGGRLLLTHLSPLRDTLQAALGPRRDSTRFGESEPDIPMPRLQSATEQPLPPPCYSPHASSGAKKAFLLDGRRVQRLKKPLRERSVDRLPRRVCEWMKAMPGLERHRRVICRHCELNGLLFPESRAQPPASDHTMLKSSRPGDSRGTPRIMYVMTHTWALIRPLSAL